MKRCIDNLGAAGLVLAIWFAWWVSNGYWLVGVLVGAIGIFIVLLLSGVAHLLLVDRRPIRRFGEPPEGW